MSLPNPNWKFRAISCSNNHFVQVAIFSPCGCKNCFMCFVRARKDAKHDSFTLMNYHYYATVGSAIRFLSSFPPRAPLQ